jgi:hypothetical protein
MSLEEGYIKIENNNYDIDSLFNFHFQANFDQLKFVIMALATAQKKTNERVLKLESNSIEVPKNLHNNFDGGKDDSIQEIKEEEDYNENDFDNNDDENELDNPPKSPMRKTMNSLGSQHLLLVNKLIYLNKI